MKEEQPDRHTDGHADTHTDRQTYTPTGPTYSVSLPETKNHEVKVAFT